MVLLVGAGLYFSIRTRFVQLRRIGVMTHLLFGKKDKTKEKKGVSSFEAFCIALSGRVGTGNIPRRTCLLHRQGTAFEVAGGGVRSFHYHRLRVDAYYRPSKRYVVCCK